MLHTTKRPLFRAAMGSAATLLVAGSGALAGFAPAQAVEADQTVVNLIDMNDFHGRIDSNTVKFAGTVEQLRAAGGEANSLFVSSGDNIGASPFASASQQDKPTIDVLNALDLKASAVGNHEFDKGYADLTGRVAAAANFSYLGANVYDKGTTTPVLDEYDVFDVAGVRVAVIGAVTQEVPSLVTPSTVSTLDFGDPVDAVNRVANKIEAGDLADVTIAAYHEGASSGTFEGSTLDQEIAAGNVFAKIVNKTDASVDAIFNGHTHKEYAWEGLIPGLTQTRPVIQTGSYGDNVGHVTLTFDESDDDVVAHTVENVARTKTDDAALVAAYPRVAQVQKITNDALKKAEVIGGQPVATVTADITTAHVDTNADGVPDKRDDRSSESTLGNLVANALRDSVGKTPAGADIGVVNPGGLRSDLLYAGSTGNDADINKDGVITYAEANAVLPFTNNLYSATMTGAQFVKTLEQQWQRTAGGEVPSRPYQQLGLSDNVRYTYDPDASEGAHIIDVMIDGVPIDAAASYKIATFSFLAAGGDNFHEFANAPSVDTGLIDREAWIDYLGEQSPISPDFARRSVAVNNLPAAVPSGGALSFELSKLDLTSLGSPKNTTVSTFTLTRAGTKSISVPGKTTVEGGNATVNLTVPRGTASGSYLLSGIATPSGTTFTVPILVERAASSINATQKPPMKIKAGKTKPKVDVVVKAPGFKPTGTVTITYEGKVVAKATLRNSEARMRLDRFASTGTKVLTVTYSGNNSIASSKTTLTMRVVK